MFQVEYLVATDQESPIAGRVHAESDDPVDAARRVSDHFLISVGGPRALANIYPHGLRWFSQMVRSTASVALQREGERVSQRRPPDSWVSTVWRVR